LAAESIHCSKAPDVYLALVQHRVGPDDVVRVLPQARQLRRGGGGHLLVTIVITIIITMIITSRMCQTFSLAPSKEQKRMETPRSPCPPHRVLGVMNTSRTVWLLLLYTVIDISFSTLACTRFVSTVQYCTCLQEVLESVIVLVEPRVSDGDHKIEESLEAGLLARGAVLGQE
jgi:hypothetical protein